MTEERMPFGSELVSRTGWLIRLRWIAVAGVAALVGAAAIWLPGVLPVGWLLAITLAIAAYNGALSLYMRAARVGVGGGTHFRHTTLLATAQIIVDLIALVMLIHFSGGVENPMVLFFVFHVIIASILLPRRVSFGMAGLAALLIAGVAGLEYSGLLAHYHLPGVPSAVEHNPVVVSAIVFSMTLTLAIVIYLTTSITTRLRQRDGMLIEANVSCQLRSQELADLNAQLQRVDAERTRFMVLVTHELRAPIATIHSSLELVRGGYTSPEETEDMLGRAQRRAAELLDLIRDLLDLERIRQEAQTAAPSKAIAPLQLADVLQEAIQFVEPEAARNGLSLLVEAPADLAPVRIPADQARLVWTNLLSNAIKYNRAGGSVRAVLSQDAEHVVGSVSDTGIGIAAGDLPHVFDEFFRAGNAKLVSAHGSGVGMATVRRVLENCGGRITVESELGKGTTFRFELPRA
jgi:signal transduction histidine kinase